MTGMPPSGPGDRADLPRSARLADARTLRPGSSIGVGVVGALAGLLLIVPAVFGPERNWALISSTTLALVLLWLFVVRPCAKIHAEGVRIVNPMRTIDITWPMIDEIRSRWVLELISDGKKYTAWGIPADPGRPRYGRGMFQLGANKVSGRKTVPEAERRPKVEAQTVAAELDERVAADRRRKDGRTPRILVRTWDATSVGLLLGAIAFWVIGLFVI